MIATIEFPKRILFMSTICFAKVTYFISIMQFRSVGFYLQSCVSKCLLHFFPQSFRNGQRNRSSLSIFLFLVEKVHSMVQATLAAVQVSKHFFFFKNICVFFCTKDSIFDSLEFLERQELFDNSYCISNVSMF